MKPVYPFQADPEDVVNVAENQPEYMTLPAVTLRDPEGTLVTRWALEKHELEGIAEGQNVILEILTFGHPLQPVRLYVEPNRSRIAREIEAEIEATCGPECKCQGGDRDHYVRGDETYRKVHDPAIVVKEGSLTKPLPAVVVWMIVVMACALAVGAVAIVSVVT